MIIVPVIQRINNTLMRVLLSFDVDPLLSTAPFHQDDRFRTFLDH